MPSFPKPKRIVNMKLLEKIRKQPCAVCNSHTTSHPHHIKTRGSGGDDVEENLIALCFEHHSEIHALGIARFLAKYPSLHLVKKKWGLDA